MHLILSLFTLFANLFVQRRVLQMARNQNPRREEHPREREGMTRAFSNLYLTAGQVADNRDTVLLGASGVAPLLKPRPHCVIQ